MACGENEVYTITFQTNGGTPAINPITVNKGNKVAKPTDPVHSTMLGKEFEGWYSDEAKTQAFDFNTPITANLTLYAKWSRYSKVPKAGGDFYDKTECVKDDETGLIWEGKTDDGGLRDKDNLYTNYYDNTTEIQKFNGNAPSQEEINGSQNTIGYVNAVNAINLGGSNNWRLPTKDELVALVITDNKTTTNSNPTINSIWFANTNYYAYWTSSAGSNNSFAQFVDFTYGTNSEFFRDSYYCIRLVRTTP